MIRTLGAFVCASTLLAAQPATADIEVSFVESAPKDRFMIRNTGECELTNLVVEIDLAPSAGRLVFDTTASGAGVDVYQPFEITAGDIKLVSSSVVEDGDTQLALSIGRLLPAGSASFTIDVDDTLPVSELGRTRVTGSEITNGLIKARMGRQQVAAVFGGDGTATAVLQAC